MTTAVSSNRECKKSTYFQLQPPNLHPTLPCVPLSNHINNNLNLGADPTIVGQACEFDYSGTQACRSLKQEAYEVGQINTNPATITADPMMADAIYLHPLSA